MRVSAPRVARPSIPERRSLRYSAYASLRQHSRVAMNPSHSDSSSLASQAAPEVSAPAGVPGDIYSELRRVAQALFAGEAPGHTLSRTGLVHEAWLRLAKDAKHAPSAMASEDFVRLSARVMRNVLVDHARARNAAKRGGDVPFARFDETLRDYASMCATGLYMPSSDETMAGRVRAELDLDVLADALVELAKLSERQAQVVDMKFFAAMSLEEIATNLGISLATVKRDWTAARLFLLRELAAARDGESGAP